ncbi:unnamed protein product [Brassica oleracea var. botrytis]|uniref:Uncharacterized protein n=1 Tax=Brassica oleracea TaxID=3712 RepID=A0A3P6AHD1_BRAOL|nr:unnamed protein product [Brassica oleracea]
MKYVFTKGDSSMEKTSLSSNEFIEMLVLDGCFVLELFRGAVEGFDSQNSDMHVMIRVLQ